MNQHANPATTAPAGISPEEWQARIDLAAVYRLCAHYGWDDIIYNHCAMRVPGEPTKFLMKQHELLWTEVTASNLRKVDMNDDLDEKALTPRIAHNPKDRDETDVQNILCSSEPWFEDDTRRIEWVNRIQLWRVMVGNPTADAHYWTTRLENQP